MLRPHTVVRPTKFTGLSAHYFFSRAVGVFAGVDYAPRKFLGNLGNFIDIPLGIAFRYPAFFGGGLGFTDVGLVLAMPLSGYSATNKTKFGVGVTLSGGQLFKVSDNFMLGFGGAFKFFFTSTVSGVPGSGSPKLLDLDIGLRARFIL